MILIQERIGKLLEDIQELIYTDVVPITEYRMLRSKERFEEVDQIDTSDWEKITDSQLWGGHREYFWFETVIDIPQKLDGKCVVYELKTGREGEWDATNPQFTIYVNGIRRQGMDVNHRDIVLTEQAQAGEQFRIMLSAFTGDHNFKLVMDSCIKALDRKTEQYYYDLSVPYGVAKLLPAEDKNHIIIINALNESLNLLDLRREHSKEYEASLARAQDYITKEFYEKYCGEESRKIYCVGHTHIDVAWLWTLAVTEDKAVRSFSTVLELMKQYPEYIFMSSQPQLYQYVQKNAPKVYEEIKGRIKEGRWEPEGGMFVEADCNLSSGESLVRQFVYGKQFFQKEFGKDNEILWLPDVFGYSAALPQIMKECGIRYFMTTKISWNEFNKMPYDTFEWEGIDGTRILTHFSPSRDYHKPAQEGGTETEHFTTYNAYINPSQVMGAWERYSQKHLNQEVLMSFGYGDGGGGPTKDMLENQRRLARGIPGCPQTVISTADTFFHTLEEHVRDHKYLPVWVGELYLEYHRGTYTSMARNKKFNRKVEFLMENAELFSYMASLLTEKVYPKETLHHDWEVVLRNQFHDILPGSSIQEVYEDSKAEYEQVMKQECKIQKEALFAVAEQVAANAGDWIVFNPNSVLGNGIVVLEGADRSLTALTDGISYYPVQWLDDSRSIFYAKNVPAKGYARFYPQQDEMSETEEFLTGKGTGVQGSSNCLENEYLKVVLASNGQIASIYDKEEQRELLKEGQNANVLMTYEDRPHNYDAWDVNNYYTEKSWEIAEAEEITLVESGAVRCTIKVVRNYLDSRIEQYLSLDAGSRELVIRNEIDWQEKKIFLKALFPVAIHTDEATFEIQYGNVTRKTHYNTSWDFARFEVCMHKWLDVAEDNYGVSVMNDCKYGVSVHDGIIGISMLKSAVYPNPEADKEHHSFTFSIYPHAGSFKEAGTIDKAYLLNNPLQAIAKQVSGGILPATYSLVQVNVPNVIIEVVKEAEQGKEMVIRLYEAFNRRTKAELTFADPIKTAAACNMLEEVKEMLTADGNKVAFTLKPFEIKTFQITF